MQVIQCLGFYFPESSGGTEVYVDGLVRELQLQGVTSVIAAAQGGDRENTYLYNNYSVYRYPVLTHSTPEEIRGIKPHGGFTYFAEWLKQQQGDIYHQHSWVTGCSIHHLMLAKALGMKTVITVHVPGNICLRGTMLLQGKQVCNGKINIVRCGTCWGMARNIPPWAAPVVARVPLSVSRRAENMNNSRLATVVATPALVATHQQRLREMAQVSDRIIAVCQWLYDALLINGIPEEKLVLCRQGVSFDGKKITADTRDTFNHAQPLRIGFLGRWDKVKGIHILVAAVRRLPPDVKVKLIIHALAQGEVAYQQQVLADAGGDTRIQFEKPVPRHLVSQTIRGFDLLAVPSQCLETGPLVVLEAQAVGVPVIGSDLGGIGELVTHQQDGWLVPHDDVGAWGEAITCLARDRGLLSRLRGGIGAVRTMADVGREIKYVYKSL
ncbi:glycosyltransferase [Anabaenopsis elenkinii]|uniref:Glycosyltransferase n=1 Tax=Anabaenopsis elenkinii CCIBt3563 TaxID=2779889 RepID=A0A7S6REE5_9CYAN|nr:glycosyltransferase [Anabaenopsis elenkinii]QOV23333.1 glycosyltransferase [Anabaenopsis elenkinii CCIBt3563]